MFCRRYCSMSPDTKFNTCSIEQELSDDDIDRELKRAEALELVRLSSKALRPVSLSSGRPEHSK